MNKLSVLLRSILLGVFLPVCGIQAALTDGLVSHWPLDAEEAGIAPDKLSNNPMEIFGTPLVVEGKVGNAFEFDGATYLLNRHSPDPAATGLPIYAAASYTIVMWVKAPAVGNKFLFSHGNTNSNNTLLILQSGTGANTAKFDVIIRTDANASLVPHRVSASDVFDDTWHHVAWVDDAGVVSLYIDGVLDANSATFNYTPGGAFTFNTTAIGTLVRAAVLTGSNLAGTIDEVGLWKRALSAEEVQEVFANGIPAITQVIAPTFVSEPLDVTRMNGDWAIFSVDVAGSRPLDYQWYKNDTLIPGATGASYQALGLTPANSGDQYHVVVSNSADTVTSRKAVVTVQADPAADVRAGLVNYWPLNEIKTVDGLLITEDLYSRNDMVLVNFADENDTVEGKFGNALSFDFISKYTYRTNGAPIYSRSNYSVSIWVKGNYTDGFSDQVDRRVFSEGSTSDNDPLFTIGTDNVTGSMGPSATVFIRSDTGAGTAVVGKRTARPVFNDEWNHIVWTDANGQGRFYVNGVLDETDFTYTRPTLSLNTTSLGAVLRAVAGNYFYGNIDEVATWGRVLSATEIQEIMNTGIPAPTGPIPADIVVHPVSQTTGIFTGDTVSFSVQPSGTAPFTYQWRKGGEPIPLAANPSAQSATLVLNNVQVTDAGAYSVVVSNSGASATSHDAQLAVTPYAPGEILKFDVGLAGSPNAQPGFPEFNTSLDGKTYNGVKVTITAVEGAVLAARNRTTGAMVANNPPGMTQAQIYNDFIFANSTSDGAGLEILLEGLTPSTEYDLTLWSFDPQSTGARFADWHEISTGVPQELQVGYTFNGSVLPVNDEDQTIKATVTSSPQGTLLLRGVKAGGTSFGVFVNALRLAVPSEGEITISNTQFVDGKIRFTVQKASESQQINIEQRADVANGTWVPATGGALQDQGATVTAEFPASEAHMFYRATVAQ